MPYYVICVNATKIREARKYAVYSRKCETRASEWTNEVGGGRRVYVLGMYQIETSTKVHQLLLICVWPWRHLSLTQAVIDATTHTQRLATDRPNKQAKNSSKSRERKRRMKRRFGSAQVERYTRSDLFLVCFFAISPFRRSAPFQNASSSS